MIDVEGNNKQGGAYEDELQPQNILCKILLNPKPKLAKEKQKKKRNQPTTTTLVQTAKLVMQKQPSRELHGKSFFLQL